ncbi:carbohydrate porin [Luteibacter aegosomatis]|uniref:carbohydrate porin n=1 Tax=Luteibacter aegosomatis TaxID=2911537 RepID=UPI001FF88845|nr:carbohydrate porin [Luteibacter aegosomatis]UPG85175.1 carbohydrate porin [Luteibacter aegosomatis]
MSYRLVSVLAFLTLLGASAAHAQTVPATAPESDDNVVERLKDEGVKLRFVWANDWAASVRGGERVGATNGGGAVGGADFDTGKLFGIKGGTIRLTFARYYGHSVAADDIGVIQKIQGYWYPKRQWQLAQLSWEQQWDNHVNLMAGRMNATWQFARSTYGCRFVSAPDCPYQLTNTTGGFSGFPYVNWGARVKYEPDARYVSIGAFEINPERRNNHGLVWGFHDSTGVMVPVEVGYETSFKTDPYPRHLKIGGWYNSADFTDPELNAKGQHRALLGGAARNYAGGRYGLYVLGDQVVYKPDPNSDTRNLAVFGSLTGPLDNAETYTLQSTAGFLWTGLSATRPTDSLGFQATWFRFSRKAVGFENDTIVKNHGTGTFKRDELMTELNYSYKLTPALSLVPNLQYIVHPDILGNTVGVKKVSSNDIVVGLRVMLNLGGPGSP